MTNLFKSIDDKKAELLTGGHAGNAPAFVHSWHGLGSDHQANNSPGDTASDRHNFDQASAGNSGVNPTDNGNGNGNG